MADSSVKNGEKVMSEVNEEIQSVYEYCLAAGLTHEEIVRRANPLLLPLKREEHKKLFFAILKIAICCVVLSYVVTIEPVNRTLAASGRKVLIKLLPLWDWTSIYSGNCLLQNPFYQPQVLMETDCKVCADMFEIDILANTSPSEIIKTYMQGDIPVVITDATTHWLAMDDSFTLLNLTEGYLTIAKNVCSFRTNLNLDNHSMVFQKLLSEDPLSNWYAHWENCDKTTDKFLRKFYSRPYFLSDIVDMTEPNWLLMSSTYKGQKFQEVPFDPYITVMWVAQVRGYNFLQLIPKEPCEDTCNILEDTLEEGEIVLFNPTLWSLSYLPGEDTENLAIGASGLSQIT